MYQPVVLYIGLRYLHGRTVDRFGRFISCLSTVGITLGVMAIITVLSVMNGFERELEHNILGLMPQALLTNHNRCLDSRRIPAAIKLNTLKGVTRITQLTTGDIILQSTHNIAIGVMLGINPKDPEPLSYYITEASQADLIADQYRVILGNELAEALCVKRGDIVRLIIPGASQFTPIGSMPSQRLFTVIGTFTTHSEIDNYQLLVNQQIASRLMRYPIGYITGWRLWLQQPLKVNALSAQPLPNGLIWRDWRESKGELFQAVRMEKYMMSILLSLLLTVAIFNVISSLGLLVIKKQAEVAILQTQGLTRWQVMLIFITQGACSGIIGALLGTGLGILLSHQLNQLFPVLGKMFNGTIMTLPVAIESLQVTIIALSAITVTLISTIYPAWRASTIHPSKILRYE